MCLELERGPLISRCMQDWLSCHMMLCLIVYPCTSKKYLVYKAWGRMSSARIISNLVKPFCINFLFVDVLVTAALPNVMDTLVCPL